MEKKQIGFLNLRRYWIVIAGVSSFFLLSFVATKAVGILILDDPSPWLNSRGFAAAFVGVGLLILDVWLPIPSSIIMFAHGALFGIWIGTLLSLLGSVGASLVGFGIGRAGNSLIKRLVTPTEHEFTGTLLKKWGLLAVLVTRPIPILAETVTILAGASPLTWSQVAIASIAGAFPATFLYALAGATASNKEVGLFTFAIVLLLAGIFWWIGRLVSVTPEIEN